MDTRSFELENKYNAEPSAKLRQAGAQYSIGILAMVAPVRKLTSSTVNIIKVRIYTQKIVGEEKKSIDIHGRK